MEIGEFVTLKVRAANSRKLIYMSGVVTHIGPSGVAIRREVYDNFHGNRLPDVTSQIPSDRIVKVVTR